MRKLQKNPSVCSPSIREARQSGLCLPRAAMKDSSYKKKNCCITFRLHLLIHHHVQILVEIMKRLSPGGISCSASKDKSDPNREAYILKKALVQAALLSGTLYPQDLSTSQNHQEFTK